MPETFTRFATRDDGETDIEVEIEVTNWGSPAHMGDMNYPGHPAEPIECEIVDAWLVSDANRTDAPSVLTDLTDAEMERIEIKFCEDPPSPYEQEDY